MKTYKVTSTWSASQIGNIATFHTSETAAAKRARKIKGHLFRHNPFAQPDHADEFGVWERMELKP